MSYLTYQNPLITRYSSRKMQELFSDKTKFEMWRKIWIILAETQMELEISDESGKKIISKKQILEMKKFATNINYKVAEKKEKEIRHDIMSHVFAFGNQCKNAENIIHLGATSCDIVCNTELWQIKVGLEFVKEKLVEVIRNLTHFAKKYKNVETVAFTHYQVAQSTTFGKRATLYIQDLIFDLETIELFEKNFLRARGIKGTTGTQASFMRLFKGNENKVKLLDEIVSKKLGFNSSYSVTGQTYPRKIDTKVLELLAGIGTSSHKFAVDLRLLSNLQIMEEPFEKTQTGSSAMAYKRNPMRSERMTSLSRELFTKPANAYQTAANQWFERTLDDSAIRRIDIAESFLLADAILILYSNITNGLVIYEKQNQKILQQEIPFLATEEILMRSVERGKSRQKIHEKIKMFSKLVAKEIKLEGKENRLFELIANDTEIPISKTELNEIVKSPKLFIGRASNQVDEFISKVVNPKLKKYLHIKNSNENIKV